MSCKPDFHSIAPHTRRLVACASLEMNTRASRACRISTVIERSYRIQKVASSNPAYDTLSRTF